MPSGLLPLPGGVDFEYWSACFIEEYAVQGIPEDLPWREFVDRIIEYDDIPDLPGHEAFDDWRAWAERAMELLA